MYTYLLLYPQSISGRKLKNLLNICCLWEEDCVAGGRRLGCPETITSFRKDHSLAGPIGRCLSSCAVPWWKEYF